MPSIATIEDTPLADGFDRSIRTTKWSIVAQSYTVQWSSANMTERFATEVEENKTVARKRERERD